METELILEAGNRHYIATNVQNHITDGWSEGPNPQRDTAGTLCIDERGSYQFRLHPDGEENPPLYTMDGIPLYRWDGQQVQPRSEAEIAADRADIPAPPPSPMEQLQAENTRLKAQVAATAQRQDFLEDCIAEMAAQVYAG